jgi:hypothetical protein
MLHLQERVCTNLSLLHIYYILIIIESFFVFVKYDFLIFYDRMETGNASLTQGVTQMIAQSSLSLSNDLLQTKNMTISDITQAKQVYNFMLICFDLYYYTMLLNNS